MTQLDLQYQWLNAYLFVNFKFSKIKSPFIIKFQQDFIIAETDRNKNILKNNMKSEAVDLDVIFSEEGDISSAKRKQFIRKNFLTFVRTLHYLWMRLRYHNVKLRNVSFQRTESDLSKQLAQLADYGICIKNLIFKLQVDEIVDILHMFSVETGRGQKSPTNSKSQNEVINRFKRANIDYLLISIKFATNNFFLNNVVNPNFVFSILLSIFVLH